MQLSVAQPQSGLPIPNLNAFQPVRQAAALPLLARAEQVSFGSLHPATLRDKVLAIEPASRQPAPDWKAVGIQAALGVGLIAFSLLSHALIVTAPIGLWLDELGVKCLMDAYQTSKQPKLPVSKSQAKALQVLAAHDPAYPRLIRDEMKTRELLETHQAQDPHSAVTKLLKLRQTVLVDALNVIENRDHGISCKRTPQLLISREGLAKRLKQPLPELDLFEKAIDILNTPLTWIQNALFKANRATVEDVVTLSTARLEEAVHSNRDLRRANTMMQLNDGDWTLKLATLDV